MFLSLCAYKIDGVILGKLKKIETHRESTNRSEVAGKIFPFAQREMVDRFLYGIDPQFEQAMERFIELALAELSEEFASSLSERQSAIMRKTLGTSLMDSIDRAVSTWREEMLPVCKESFMREVQSVICLMPKQELAALAEELVNLTSVRRKFSSAKESVGGPIDVAVISRIDGFVWIRRKHYFEPNLNPRYFKRKFGPARLEGVPL